MSSNLAKKTVKGLIWSGGNVVVNAILKIIVVALLSRLLTPYDFGIAATAIVLINIIIIFGEVGMGSALIQKKDSNSDYYNTAFTFSLLLGTILSISIFFSAYLFAKFFQLPELTIVIKYISALILIRSLSNIAESLILKELQFKKIALIKVSSYLIGYAITSPILAYLGYGYWSIIVGTIIQFVIEAILLFVNINHKFRLFFSKNLFYVLFDFGLYFSLSRIFTTISNQGENIVIAKYLGTIELGLYSRAQQIFMLPVQLLGTAISKTLFPSFSIVQDNKSLILSIYLSVTLITSLICFPLTYYLFVNSETIVLILLGDQWNDIVIPVKILFVALFFRISYKFIDPILNATNKVKEKAFVQFIYAINTIGLSIYLSHWGLNGVMAALSISVITHFMLMNIILLRHLEGSCLTFLSSILPGLFILLLLILVESFMISNFYSDHYLTNSLINTLVFLILYPISLLLIFPYLNKKYPNIYEFYKKARK